MPDHLTDDELQRFTGRTLDPAALLAVDDHLASCPLCRARLDGVPPIARRATAFARALARDTFFEHLSYEQLEAYADDTLDSVTREICDVHLSDCAACAEDLDDLRAAAAPEVPIAHPRAKVVWARVFQLAAAIVVIASAASIVWLVNGRAPSNTAAVRDTATAAPPAMRVALADDRTVVGIGAGGEAVLPGGWPENYRGVLTQALQTGRLPSAPRLDVFAGGGPLMGAPAAKVRFGVTSPVGVTVESDRPTLTWQAVPGARYRVSVFNDRFETVATSGTLQDTSWTPAARLRRGARYVWQVTADVRGRVLRAPVPPDAEAAFAVLDAGKAAAIAAARLEHPDAHLLLGMMLYQSGVFDEARREFDALLRANPSSPLARALRDQVPSPTRTNPAQ